MATVLVIGTLDTKGPEIAYLKSQIENAGARALVMDSGILGEAEGIVPDISRQEVAVAAGSNIDALRNAGSRGKAVEEMLKGVRAIALDLYKEGKIHGVTSLGGAEGLVLATAAMKVLPIGLPKLVVSPIASGQRPFGPFVGTKDIMVMHSVVDILGLNDISCRIYDTVAAAIAGAAISYEKNADRKPSGRKQIAATMLGNTTRPLMRVRPGLEKHGYDLVIYHANGVGGPAMEEAIMEDQFVAVLDYTLSEMAGNVAGGFHVGGEKRMTAAALADVPQLVVPGCVDFIVFGPPGEIPEALRSRPTYYHNPQFTLVRVNKDEQIEVARQVAVRLNAATAPVHVLVPLGGVSIMDIEGGAFWDPDIDTAFRETLKNHLDSHVRYEEVPYHINANEFADIVLERTLNLLKP